MLCIIMNILDIFINSLFFRLDDDRMADTVYFFVCLILRKIYVKKIIVFLICKYKKYHLHGLSLAVSNKGVEREGLFVF